MISYMNQYPRSFASNNRKRQEKRAITIINRKTADKSRQIAGLACEDAQIRQDGFSSALLCTSFIHDNNDDMRKILHYEHRIYIYHSTKYMFINFMMFYLAKERLIEKKSFDLKIKLHENKLERNTKYNNPIENLSERKHVDKRFIYHLNTLM